jgi:hypothetical protein
MIDMRVFHEQDMVALDLAIADIERMHRIYKKKINTNVVDMSPPSDYQKRQRSASVELLAMTVESNQKRQRSASVELLSMTVEFNQNSKTNLSAHRTNIYADDGASTGIDAQNDGEMKNAYIASPTHEVDSHDIDSFVLAGIPKTDKYVNSDDFLSEDGTVQEIPFYKHDGKFMCFAANYRGVLIWQLQNPGWESQLEESR